MDLTLKQHQALKAYAEKHGRNWKSKLKEDWRMGRDEQHEGGGYLRQIRNIFGPVWLSKFKF